MVAFGTVRRAECSELRRLVGRERTALREPEREWLAEVGGDSRCGGGSTLFIILGEEQSVGEHGVSSDTAMAAEVVIVFDKVSASMCRVHVMDMVNVLSIHDQIRNRQTIMADCASFEDWE
jgi:hypothetical protein